MRRPLCFILMPFDRKRDLDSGGLVNFDEIYESLIRPAVEGAGLRPFRADEEFQGGIFHKPMFERLIMCEYAVADLSLANANVFYELGVRHGCRPWTTVLIHQDTKPLPLDVAMDSSLAYRADQVADADGAKVFRKLLTRRLLMAKERSVDSPVFQLVAGMPEPDVDHRRVDAMVEEMDHEADILETIEDARAAGVQVLREIQAKLGELENLGAQVLLSLLLAYRSVQAWQDMIRLVGHMPDVLAETVLVREQHALALARGHQYAKAERMLLELLKRRPSSETFGLLGGTYKRMWINSSGRAESYRRAILAQAEDAYRRGFYCDWRDPYPGVNAVALKAVRLNLVDTTDELFSVVRFSARQRLMSSSTDYWDHACVFELAVLSGDRPTAMAELGNCLARLKEPFEASTTAENLDMITGLCNEGARHELWLEVRHALGEAQGSFMLSGTAGVPSDE